jgi:serine/threonine protein kinase
MPENISENAKDLLSKMIDYRNDERITFADVIKHPWFT